MSKLKKVFTYEFWQSDKPSVVESKFKIIGLIVAVLVSLFAYFVLKINNNRWDKRMENVNKKADERQDVLIKKADSASIVSWNISRQMYEMRSSMRADSARQAVMNINFNKNFEEIKKLKNNEKDFVPDDAPFDEQLRYISNVKYKPVK